MDNTRASFLQLQTQYQLPLLHFYRYLQVTHFKWECFPEKPHFYDVLLSQPIEGRWLDVQPCVNMSLGKIQSDKVTKTGN